MPSQHRIRVAVVIPDYGLIGGAESLVFELTERLARRGVYEIHVLANRWRSGEADVCFHRIPMIGFPRWLRPISFAWFVQRVLDAGHYDIVHIVEAPDDETAASMAFSLGALGNVRIETMRAFDRAEMTDILEKVQTPYDLLREMSE